MPVDIPQEPAYAGFITFAKLPYGPATEDLSGADVAILGAPMDEMVTYRPGTRFGPRAIREAYDDAGHGAHHMDIGVRPLRELRVMDHGDAEVVPGDPHASHRAIRKAVTGVVGTGTIPIVLGGDHSIAYPDIAAVAEALEHGSLAVVQFDTHADTGTENWGVKWAHGTPFRNLVDQGVIRGDRLIQVGLRGYWPFPEEWEWMRGVGVRWHRMEEVFERGIDAIVDDVLVEIADAAALFLSVDIDVLDPAFAPGTGTPEPGGMSTHDLLKAVRRLSAERDLVGMDLVEVSPPYDPSGITALAAHRIVLSALSGIALRRSGRDPSPERSMR